MCYLLICIKKYIAMQKYSFSGHETFHCRQFWLKKGYDFTKQQGQFSDDDAGSALGVGRNMVISLQHWLKSFGLLTDEQHPVCFI
jgi:hypothetical protein